MYLKTCFFVLAISQIVMRLNCDIVKKNFDSNFTIEYFSMRNVQNVVLFICSSKTENIGLIKKFSENNIRVSILDLNHKIRQKDINNMFRVESTTRGVVYDFCCHDSKKSPLEKYTYFNDSYIWLMFDCGSFKKTIEYIELLPLSIRTDIIVASNVDMTSVSLFDIYHSGIDRNGVLNVTHVANISTNDNNIRDNSQMVEFFKQPKSIRRRNLNGLMIRAVTLMENNKNNIDTHTYLVDETNKHLDSIFKMNYPMILILQRIYNFTIKFVLANNWSDKNSKGQYKSGNLLGVLAHGKADIMAGSMVLVNDRLEITDVLYLTYPFRCGFIFRYQGDFGENKSSFLTPFSTIVWYSFLAIVIIVIIIIWIMLTVENKFIVDVNKSIWNFSDSFLSVIGACCQMGSEVTPATSSSRIVYVIFFFTSLIIYNFYTSSIVSSLLNYGFETFTIIDLADSPLKCGSLDVGYVHNLLFDTPVYPNMEYFNKKKKTEDFYFTIKEGIAKVKNGGFAYHAEYNSFYHMIENTFEATEICELKEIVTIPSSKLGIMGLKYSPYSEMFKVGLTKASETGHLKRLLHKWVARQPECQASKSFTEVNLLQITPSHVVLYIGFVVSILILVFEKITSAILSQEEHYLKKIIFENRIIDFIYKVITKND